MGHTAVPALARLHSNDLPCSEVRILSSDERPQTDLGMSR